MTIRKPVVLVDGVLSQLPDGDTLNAELDEMAYIEEIDFVGDTVIYKGWAVPGTAFSDATWRIQKIEFVGVDEDVRKRWANDDAGFSHVWDNRASLTY